MKLSCVSNEALQAMTTEQKWNFVCGGVKDDGDTGDVALLLGTYPEGAKERALAAARLYHAGRVREIVASGGVKWDYEGENISEADFMARILEREGVPREAIILDNEARTTKENMICGTLEINRKNKFYTVDTVIIVTTEAHMKRSMALAKAFLPRKVAISAYPSYPDAPKEEWLKNEENIKLLDNAIRLMKGLVDHRIVEDMEIDLD